MKLRWLLVAFLASENLSFVPGAEFGLAHIMILVTGILIAVNHGQIQISVILFVLLLYAHTTVVSLMQGYNGSLIFRSFAICTMLCATLYVSKFSFSERLINEINKGLEYYVKITFIVFLASFAGPLRDLFWFDGRYKFVSSEPFNLAAIMIVFLFARIHIGLGRTDQPLAIMAIITILFSQSASAMLPLALLFLMDYQKRRVNLTLFMAILSTALLTPLILQSAVFFRVIDNLTAMFLTFGRNEFVYNTTAHAIASTWYVATSVLTSQFFGYGAGNFSVAYWTYIEGMPNYIAAMDSDLIGVNAKGGAGLYQRLIGEFGLGAFLVLSYFAPNGIFRIQHLLLLAFLLSFVFRLENIFKPDLLVLLILISFVIRKTGSKNKFKENVPNPSPKANLFGRRSLR